MSSSSSSCTNPTESRRERMLARLNARHPVSVANTIPASRDSNDVVLARAQKILDSELMRDSIEDEEELRGAMCELQSLLSVLPNGTELRRARDILAQLRDRAASSFAQLPTKGFAFAERDKQVPAISSSTNESRSVGEGIAKQVAMPKDDRDQGDARFVVVKMVDEHRVLASLEQDAVLEMRDSHNSHLIVPSSLSTALLCNVRDCTVILRHVQSSILIRDCEDVTIAVAAQQIRVHSSKRLRIHAHVTGAIIIEHCDHIQVAPLFLHGVEFAANDRWRRVQDFNWLNASVPSPHWEEMPEADWTRFTLVPEEE